MLDWKSPAEWKRLFRYYQAGIVNTAFGYGLFALFIWLGMNMYVAQIVSHVAGVAFNYLTYSRYAFRDHDANLKRFILSYGVNYLLSVACLAAATHVIASPYVAGLIATIFVSAVNYLVLKRLVFTGLRS